jgi:hypothetical protein
MVFPSSRVAAHFDSAFNNHSAGHDLAAPTPFGIDHGGSRDTGYGAFVNKGKSLDRFTVAWNRLALADIDENFGFLFHV